jgi:hypothetical protein
MNLNESDAVIAARLEQALLAVRCEPVSYRLDDEMAAWWKGLTPEERLEEAWKIDSEQSNFFLTA